MTIEISNSDVIADRCQELATLVMRHTEANGNIIQPTAIAQLDLTRSDAVSTVLHGVYQPILAIVVQGQKEVLLGEQRYQYGAGQYLVVSVELPLSSFVVQATPDQPYLGLKLNLDPMHLCDLVAQMSSSVGKKENSVRGISVSNVDVEAIECALRLVKLLDTPQHIPMLAPLMIRELYYRLLIGEQGEAVRQIATSGSNMQRIASAIKLIEAEFTQQVRIENLARRVSMSTSSFHQHFKQVTSMSPLQYQKQLRLLEARRLMLAENADAAYAAYRVGYESSSQFSREYSRLFGAPPMRDIERLRTA
ncbi:AraC family transcriptional regulator [Chroococcidiopsis sp. FACHB-1243]|uniref:AraC family transcriptional regulator n=1 Tax=Chroococcidiopsis sp. [FACHB-1243] TaxID=2692781 RepID=UPI00177FED35|nr:AraC family transcriptional regulator [Chroococcidiopsis sp. [FACHB-1243]]MBD2309325.1 AraC family transcriptional regulator [Chroococcidiopsis sp. [FACHB-1243]]